MTTAIAVVKDGEACVEGELRHVFVHQGTADKREVPAEVRSGLEPYLTAG
jgi:acyl-CoA thioesterase FadM